MSKTNKEKLLLDCTLRDGGYVNDWAFGADYIPYIFERQVSSGVDVIEVGFLDERRSFDPNRTIMPDTDAVNRIFGELDGKQAMKVAMIDYGTCALEHIMPCAECWLDGIRVIFKKDKMHKALAFCGALKALGYQVFVQAVSITSYNDDELGQLIELVNRCGPYAMSMVDTYGLLDPAGLEHIISVVDAGLEPGVTLGYHAHNNFQLAYANTLAMLNHPFRRNILVDGTLYGMGKSAGNAPIELIAMYMNVHFGKRYDVLQMQEAISTSILDIYRKRPWGYTLFYYIAAANKCHPDYVSWLMNKRTLSITAINEILQRLPEEERLNKNMKLVEQLYLDYQSRECDDSAALEELHTLLAEAPILLLGPGMSVKTQPDRVRSYIREKRPNIIAINYIPDKIKADYLFLTNSHRYLQIAGKLLNKARSELPIIATSNVRRTDGTFPFVVNYSSLIDPEAEVQDNSLIMLLKLLIKLGSGSCALAGFDGYTPDAVNYLDAQMEYGHIREKAESLNRYGRNFIHSVSDKLRVKFLTKSFYQE